jgi:cytoskeletal protein CcmA (bactofilin family)
VNGRISLGNGAQASEASTVNGNLTLSEGADVAGELGNVNGKISLNDAHVGGGIKTANGDISLLGASRVEGGIEVHEAASGLFSSRDPVVVIGPGATVQGELVFKRKVKLYVSDRATIGNVIGATAVTYSGDKPAP